MGDNPNDNGTTGLVFDIQRCSLHDGPGIRTTVFLKGCPLRCKWCHNPESLDPMPEISLTPTLCIGCGRCVQVCPRQAHRFTEDNEHLIDRDRCVRCGRCADECPAGALEMVGKEMSADEVLDEVRRDKVFYDESGGGMTLSGGEVLAQSAFGAELLRRAKAEGFHTAIETSGHAPWERLERLLPHVDLILYDLKFADSDRHREFTGVPNETIRDNLRRVCSQPRDVEVRVPMITGYNTDDGNIDAIGRFLSSLPHPPRMHLLKYNVLAPGKYARVGRAYPLEAKPPTETTPEQLAHARDILASYGLTVETD